MSRIVFMGTPEFALSALKALIANKYNVVAVYTQPPRPKGRGHHETISPVHAFANENDIPVHHPISLKSENELAIFKSYNADLAIVAAYGLLLPKQILNAPKLGCINIHASLLPKWRGAAPIQRAIEAGDQETGITLMQMDAGLDTGDMLFKSSIAIDNNDTSQTLFEKLQILGSQCLLENLDAILNAIINPVAQNKELATYAKKLKKEESLLDTSINAEILERKIRAFNPWPSTYLTLDNEPIKIIKAVALQENSHNHKVGTWFKNSKGELFVACQDSILQILELQKPNSKPTSAAGFINGHRGSGITQIF
jgi:methionyl-tRNA formyltransferase